MSSAEVRLSRSSPKHIGSVDPYALKIPAPKGRNTSLQWNVTSPFQAEPGHELIRQLYNPACDALEWKQIALGLAQFTGRAFATGDLLKPSEIEIDFPKLCDYLVRRQLNFPADDN